MLYNIDFEVAGLFFLVAILVYYFANYKGDKPINRLYRKIVILVILMNIFDIATGYSISYFTKIPVWLNMVLNAMNFSIIAIVSYIYSVYVKAMIVDDMPETNKFNFGVLVVFLVSEVVNCFSGFYFSFDPQLGYVHGPLFVVQSLIDIYYLFYAVYLLIRYHGQMNYKQIFSTLTYVILIVVGTIIQLSFMPWTLLGGFGASVCTLIAFVTLETPEYEKLIKLLNEYNDDLEKAVDKKTRSLNDVHNKLLLGIADIVESRDDNTGGHIKRTSRVIEILSDAMRADETLDKKYDEHFFRCLVKAAPMHDLGKIAVDDALLRKTGKFSKDEFEKMKLHSLKGGEIAHKVLAGIEEDYFENIAANVANYHHERFDGTGYPKGLKGEEIPFEARIMAIADVYDALVSKRCYKEKFSFEEAFEIIEEEMGTHFDPALNKYFVECRGKLEEYYSGVEC